MAMSIVLTTMVMNGAGCQAPALEEDVRLAAAAAATGFAAGYWIRGGLLDSRRATGFAAGYVSAWQLWMATMQVAQTGLV
jgi:hypothetical protein